MILECCCFTVVKDGIKLVMLLNSVSISTDAAAVDRLPCRWTQRGAEVENSRNEFSMIENTNHVTREGLAMALDSV